MRYELHANCRRALGNYRDRHRKEDVLPSPQRCAKTMLPAAEPKNMPIQFPRWDQTCPSIVQSMSNWRIARGSQPPAQQVARYNDGALEWRIPKDKLHLQPQARGIHLSNRSGTLHTSSVKHPAPKQSYPERSC